MDADLFAGLPVAFAVLFAALAAIGIAVVVAGVRLLLRARRRGSELVGWAATGRTVTGTIVDNRMTSRPERRMSFSPVVRFEVDGQEHVVVGDQTSYRSFVTGVPAEVVFDPADPTRAGVLLDGVQGVPRSAGGLAVLVMGLVFLTVLAVFAGLTIDAFRTF